MCLAIPLRLVEVNGKEAVAEANGVRRTIRVDFIRDPKEGDYVIYTEDTDNRAEVLFFTDKGQIYRAKVDDFELSKAPEFDHVVVNDVLSEAVEEATAIIENFLK